MRYIPHCESDILAMLEKIGAKSVDELFEQIPKQLRFNKDLQLPEPISESELSTHILKMASSAASEKTSFMGGGMYQHHVSATVDQLLLRSEFYTAYTPYQPEVSQGTLQAIFEFQTMISRLFGMNVANASMYDGATALVEAALMARRVLKKREKIVVSAGVHPEYIETLLTYLRTIDNNEPQIEIVALNDQTGQTDLVALENAVDDQTACVIAGYPNFFGIVERIDEISKIASEKGAKMITSTCETFAFGVLTPPSELGVDIATAEGQGLGVPVSYGGPGIGLFAIKDDKKLLRQIPGRLIGKTVDTNGKEGFVLTLATREQHIRREKATSNICTNHGLCALAVSINLSLLGKIGFVDVAKSCLARSEFLKAGIFALDGYSARYSGATFNEFTVKCHGKKASDVLKQLENKGFLGGINLGRFDKNMDDTFMVAVTEIIMSDKLDAFIKALSEI